MKHIYTFLAILTAAILNTACNDEWKDEQYQQYVSFKSPIPSGGEGVTNIYVRYKPDGKVTYQLPVIISGSTQNQQEVDVHIALSDTLETLNWERFSTRTDLYYQELESDKYDFSKTVHIPAGSDVGLLDINFSLNGLDMANKWVLPLTVADDESYKRHPRKNYATALLRVIPFNDYSGSYSTDAMEVYIKDANGKVEKKPMTTPKRTAYVVDNNTVFFYAGLIGEELKKEVREIYKINVTFNNEDNSLHVEAENKERIGFNLISISAFSDTSTMDATRPYLKRKFISFDIEYEFNDVTSTKDVKIPYLVKGTMTLQRNINTQIPDEDQQIEW